MSEPDDAPDMILDLTMHEANKVVFASVAYGMRPNIITTIKVDDDSETVTASVECFGIGKELTDVKHVGVLLEIIAAAICAQADQAYPQSQEISS